MKRAHLCGIYVIEHVATGRFYVGSSADISGRWTAHRYNLNLGTHTNPRLLRAWTKYGPDAFRMFVLEECDRVDLIEREQAYIDGLHPWFNIAPRADRPPPASPEFIARLRTRMAAITHCPAGHEYTQANTHLSKAGKRICRACAAERTRKNLTVETPERREIRRQNVKADYEKNRVERIAYGQARMVTRKAEKRAYDQSRAALKAERNRARRMTMTPEQHAAHLEQKRAYYERNREKVSLQLREAYRRRRDRAVG